MLRSITHNEVIVRVMAGQKGISTNEDISDYSYVKAGKQNDIQTWILKRVQQEASIKWRERNQEHDANYYNAHKNHYKGIHKKWESTHRAERNKYNSTGLRGERHKIRAKYRRKYLEYKRIIASGSQIHHDWIPGTADYRGVALVETDQHMHGIVDVIEILEGEIRIKK